VNAYEVSAPEAVERLREAVHRIAADTRDRRATGTSHEDADDIHGSVATDGAIGFDPFPVLEALCRHDAHVVVMGQVAGIMHGSTELTGDLDLLWDGHMQQAPRLAAALASAAATITDGDGAPLSCAPDAFHLPKVLFRTPTVSGDCCTPSLPWGDLDIAGIIRRAETAVEPSGLTIHYVSLADLIVMRRAAGRTKDHRRADELEPLL
jgi:hypothetical protein